MRVNSVPGCAEGMSDEMLLAFMQQACGLHSDACDTDELEVIVYVHMKTGSGVAVPPASNAVGTLGLALRLRGGAALTRHQQKQNKKRTKTARRQG